MRPIPFLALPLLALSLQAADYDRVLCGEPSHDFVVIDYNGQTIPKTLDAMLRYNTVIRIPQGELAMEAAAGDAADPTKPGSGEWLISISKEGDAVYVKPTKQGIATGIEIRTDHGNRYTFYIADRSLAKDAHPHVEYIVNPTGSALVEAIKAPAKWVPAEKLAEALADASHYKSEMTDLENRWERRSAMQLAGEREKVLTEQNCDDYKLDAEANKLGVTRACHDREWSYVYAPHARDHFAVADMSSGSAVLVNPEYDPANGMYTIHAIPTKIRLSIGNGKKTKNADIELKKGA